MQNVIIKGRDNPVIFTFNFNGDFAALGLGTFTSIQLTILSDVGNVVYSTDTNPSQLFIVGTSQLRLKIGDSTELDPGRYAVEIVGYSATYDDGYELSGKNRPVFDKIKIV